MTCILKLPLWTRGRENPMCRKAHIEMDMSKMLGAQDWIKRFGDQMDLVCILQSVDRWRTTVK